MWRFSCTGHTDERVRFALLCKRNVHVTLGAQLIVHVFQVRFSVFTMFSFCLSRFALFLDYLARKRAASPTKESLDVNKTPARAQSRSGSKAQRIASKRLAPETPNPQSQGSDVEKLSTKKRRMPSKPSSICSPPPRNAREDNQEVTVDPRVFFSIQHENRRGLVVLVPRFKHFVMDYIYQSPILTVTARFDHPDPKTFLPACPGVEEMSFRPSDNGTLHAKLALNPAPIRLFSIAGTTV